MEDVLKLSGKMVEVQIGELKRKSLKEVLMRRDGLSAADAETAIREAANQVLFDSADPEELLADEFGLEPDYVFDLLDAVK